MYSWMPAWYQAIRYPLLLAQTSIGMLVFFMESPPAVIPQGSFLRDDAAGNAALLVREQAAQA